MDNKRVLKILFREELRRILLEPEELTLEKIKDLTKSLFSSLKGPFHFLYKDDEGDLIHVVTERELAEAVRTSGENEITLKLVVVEKSSFKNSCNTAPCFLKNICGKNRKGPCFLRPPLILISLVLLFAVTGCFKMKCLLLLPVLWLGVKFGRRFLRKGCKGNWKRNCDQWKGCPFSSSKEEEPVEEPVEEESERDVDESKNINREEVIPEVNEQEQNLSFVKKLKQLEDMGFMDKQKNIAILVKYKANLVDAVKELLES